TVGDGSVIGFGTAVRERGIAALDVPGATAGAVTIEASAAGLTSATTSFTVVAGAATQLVFTSDASDLSSGATRTLRVEVHDASRTEERREGEGESSRGPPGGEESVRGPGRAVPA